MNTKLEELDALIAEMSSATAGANTGHAGHQGKPPLGTKKSIKDSNEKEEEQSRLKGKRLAEEEEDEDVTEALLRKHIRQRLTAIFEAQETVVEKQLREEKTLRSVIRGLIMELEDTNPHPNTGINKLRDAFKKAKPTIRRFYKQLTTDQDQRESFSAHLLRAFQRMFDEVDAMSAIKGAQSEPQSLLEPSTDDKKPQDDDINVDINPADEEIPELIELNQSGIIIEQDESELSPEMKSVSDKEDERSEFGAGLEDFDKTGRNQALDAMKLIRSYFSEPYNDMENDGDKEQFRSWALYNLDLLMKSYEEELKATVQAPSIEV